MQFSPTHFRQLLILGFKIADLFPHGPHLFSLNTKTGEKKDIVGVCTAAAVCMVPVFLLMSTAVFASTAPSCLISALPFKTGGRFLSRRNRSLVINSSSFPSISRTFTFSFSCRASISFAYLPASQLYIEPAAPPGWTATIFPDSLFFLRKEEANALSFLLSQSFIFLSITGIERAFKRSRLYSSACFSSLLL